MLLTAILLVAMAGLIVFAVRGAQTWSGNGHAPPKLHAATASGRIAEVKRSLDTGVSVNQKGPDGQTPLMVAIANGHRSLALTLILLGADLTEQDDAGRTVMMIAVEKRDDVFLQRLRQLAEISYTQDAAERKARLAGFSGVDRTLLAGRDFDLQNLSLLEVECLKDKDGETASIKAARAGLWEALGLVATQTDSILARDHEGRTVAMHAAIEGHTSWFERLENDYYFGGNSRTGPIAFVGEMMIFDLECSLSVRDKNGKSVLQLAEQHGRTRIADILRRHLQAIVDSQTAAINAGGDSSPTTNWSPARLAGSW